MKKIHGNVGRKHTEEWKEKMSKRNSGKNNPFYSKKHSKKTLEKITGENHHSWKGDNASYKAIHNWVHLHKGKPKKCEHCGRNDMPASNYEWANIDHKYKRKIEDWIRLCPKCHSDYDVKMGLRKYNKQRNLLTDRFDKLIHK